MRPRVRRLLYRAALAGAALLACATAQAEQPPEWSRPTPPFHIVGPIYYVGTEGIGVYLIRTAAGLILLDAGPENAAPVVKRSIAALGFRMRDVKLMLATHAHLDHAGGLARLKRDSGATFVASVGDRGALETGAPPSDTDYGVWKFPPIKVDRVLADGRPVVLGGVAMTPLLTPGHTPGCTTWTMRVADAGRTLRVVFPCSMSVAGNMLVGNRGYPGILADYRRTFARMRALKADIVLPAHPEQADVIARAHRRDAGDRSAFLAPGLLQRLVADNETAFENDLRRQRQGGNMR